MKPLFTRRETLSLLISDWRSRRSPIPAIWTTRYLLTRLVVGW